MPRTERRWYTRPPAQVVDRETGKQCGDTIRFDIQFSNVENRDNHLECKPVIYYGSTDLVSPEAFLERAKDLDPELAMHVAGKFRIKGKGIANVRFFDESQDGADRLVHPYRCYYPEYLVGPNHPVTSIDQAEAFHPFMHWIEDSVNSPKLCLPRRKGGIFRQGVMRNSAAAGRPPTEMVFGLPFENEWPGEAKVELRLFDPAFATEDKLMRYDPAKKAVDKQKTVKLALFRSHSPAHIRDQLGTIILLNNDFVRMMLLSIYEAEKQQRADFARDGVRIIPHEGKSAEVDFEFDGASTFGEDISDLEDLGTGDEGTSAVGEQAEGEGAPADAS